MKTVILMRHTEVQALEDTPRELQPISLDGVMAAKALFKAPAFESVTQVWASTCRRAYETAMIFDGGVTLDSRLDEDSSKEKIGSFVDEVLRGLGDGEAALAVSHAETIGAYLGSSGEMAAPSAFVLGFEDGDIKEIRYLEQT